jgi:hypothetical protein
LLWGVLKRDKCYLALYLTVRNVICHCIAKHAI